MYQPGCIGNFWVAEGTSQPVKGLVLRSWSYTQISWGKTLGTVENQIIQMPSRFQMKNPPVGSKFYCLIGSAEYLFFSHHFQDRPPKPNCFFIFKHKFEIFSLWILMFWILELQLKPKVMELGIGISLIDNSKKLEIRTSL